MSHYRWDTQFTELFERCLARYRAGDEDFATYYTSEDLEFLTSIGYKPRELFDFVEDYGDGGEPSLTTAVMIASVRRDYLDTVMKGQLSDQEITPDQLPAKDSELDGIRWLPRILVKARAKLRGELHPDIMFCCGGDRAFLRQHDVAPADFLRAVWASNGDDAKVLAYLKD
ncbi:MAG: DUF5069 domain-containing protein [Verrucomicrobiae bacterium]|nr:DUF5069 domain-containing protein [Verrucomicrobiae bacterium]